MLATWTMLPGIFCILPVFLADVLAALLVLGCALDTEEQRGPSEFGKGAIGDTI